MAHLPLLPPLLPGESFQFLEGQPVEHLIKSGEEEEEEMKIQKLFLQLKMHCESYTYLLAAFLPRL